MKILIIAIVLGMVLVGCCGLGGLNPKPPISGQGSLDNTTDGITGGGDANASSGDDANAENAGTDSNNDADSGNGTVSDANSSDDNVTADQQDCATMTPNCESCIIKPGCGWCKTRNGCFAGTSSGPSQVDCAEGDWAKTEEQCAAPAGGSTCGKQTNCASCTTGSDCMWCRQGSICVEVGNAASCLGGWLSEGYQCAQTSAG